MKAAEESNFIVIDNSVAMAWVMDDERSPFSERLLVEIQSEAQAITIPLFWDEVLNTLIVNERRKRVGKGGAGALLLYLRSLGVEERPRPSDAAVIELAYRYQLTGYDASYLALAIEERSILATNDKQLAQAALREGLGLRTMLDLA